MGTYAEKMAAKRKRDEEARTVRTGMIETGFPTNPKGDVHGQRLEYLYRCLIPGIHKGDPASITAAAAVTVAQARIDGTIRQDLHANTRNDIHLHPQKNESDDDFSDAEEN